MTREASRPAWAFDATSVLPIAAISEVDDITAEWAWGGSSGKGVKVAVFARGLQWAIDNGMDVCNLSLGSTRRDLREPLHELTDLAYFRDVALVTAANNLPIRSAPSLYAAVISVAAHDVRDPNVIYCNPDPPVEFGASGIDVRVPWKGGGWITATGNSFAAPHITGLVARIRAKHPGLAVFHLKGILRALAANMVRDGDPGGEE